MHLSYHVTSFCMSVSLEICRQSIEPAFNCLLHFFIATHVHAAQKLL
jgi:hypothetical protein